MAKRFSIVTLNNNENLFLRGFVEPSELSNSELFLDMLSEFSSFEKVAVEIEHCLLLDYPGKDENISISELEELVDKFDILMEANHLYSEELLSFELYGIKEDEYIEG